MPTPLKRYQREASEAMLAGIRRNNRFRLFKRGAMMVFFYGLTLLVLYGCIIGLSDWLWLLLILLFIVSSITTFLFNEEYRKQFISPEEL